MLDEWLKPFKQAETVESAVLLMDDPTAKRLVAYWPNYPLAWSQPRGTPPEDPRDRWRWLWDGMPVNLALLAVQTGIAKNLVGNAYEIAQANRLIYPDRTISTWASKILRAEVMKRYTT